MLVNGEKEKEESQLPPFANNLALACSAQGHLRLHSIGLEEPANDSLDQQHLRRLSFPSIHLTQQQLSDLTPCKGGHTVREQQDTYTVRTIFRNFSRGSETGGRAARR
jgi:hypothetical protein